MLELFPDTAAVEAGELEVGGVSVTRLAAEYGTPLVAYCEETIRTRARAYRRAAPDALVAYSVKAFPNVQVVRVLMEEGLGAEASTLGELAYARTARIPGELLVLDGNNKSDGELAAGADARALLVLDAPDEVARAARVGVRRALIRVTPGIDAETHTAIATGHTGSKFGLPPEQALAAFRHAREAGIEVEGLHVHIGSQLLDLGAERMTIEWLAGFAAECRADLGWEPGLVDLGGGLGIRYQVDDPRLPVESFVQALVERVARAWRLHGLEPPRLALEPGRSLVGQAGFTIYRVGVVKQASETITYVAVDGGMSDNPRPQLYGARHAALLANRADEEPDGAYAVCGKHCESGDVLIERAPLPEPRRGDLLAVAGTGAYTLGMSSNYNVVPRPAAVLVNHAHTRLILRAETLDDLFGLEI